MNLDQGALTEPVYYILLSLQKLYMAMELCRKFRRLTKGRLVVGREHYTGRSQPSLHGVGLRG